MVEAEGFCLLSLLSYRIVIGLAFEIFFCSFFPTLKETFNLSLETTKEGTVFKFKSSQDLLNHPIASHLTGGKTESQ